MQAQNSDLLRVLHCAGTCDVPSSRRSWGTRCAFPSSKAHVHRCLPAPRRILVAMSQQVSILQVALWGWDTLRCEVIHPMWPLHAECTRQQLPWATQRPTSTWVPYMEVRFHGASIDLLLPSSCATAPQSRTHQARSGLSSNRAPLSGCTALQEHLPGCRRIL